MTIAEALAKPSVVASALNAASVGANTVRLEVSALSAGTRPALSAAATNAVKPRAVASAARVPGGAGSSLPPQAATMATAQTAVQILNRRIIVKLLDRG